MHRESLLWFHFFRANDRHTLSFPYLAPSLFIQPLEFIFLIFSSQMNRSHWNFWSCCCYFVVDESWQPSARSEFILSLFWLLVRIDQVTSKLQTWMQFSIWHSETKEYRVGIGAWWPSVMKLGTMILRGIILTLPREILPIFFPSKMANFYSS